MSIQLVTIDEALAMLPDGEDVHTFRGGGGMMIGADWRREGIEEALRAAEEIHLSGPFAMAMGHGLAIMNNRSWLFIETKKATEAATV